MESFLKYNRKIQEHWIYKDSQYFHAWSEMLLKARYSKEPKTDTYDGVLYKLNYGEFIFGRESWSKRLVIGEQKLRIFIRKLIAEDMIVLKYKHNKFTIYFITNYEKYNQQNNRQQSKKGEGIEQDKNRQKNRQRTGRQPAENRQATTKEESKESKEGKESISGINDKKKLTTYTTEFEEFYNIYPNSFNKLQTFKNWITLLNKESIENIMLATRSYIEHLERNGITDKQYITRSTNFIGLKGAYAGYLEIEEDELYGKLMPNGAIYL